MSDSSSHVGSLKHWNHFPHKSSKSAQGFVLVGVMRKTVRVIETSRERFNEQDITSS